ncbi:CheY-like superfamily protein [Tribonema minus]|uniref:CheY-like superfamily protein n=1 Tax=Tribonema minus TaxID=303371 RepID=A0A836CCS3_9STRA|nr:CheY-like superfamily protein [Tribonema minus]
MPIDAYEESSEPGEAKPRRPVCIVAEDSEVTAKMLTKMVKQLSDFEVAVRDHSGHIVCALMDVNMPNTGGIDATRKIRFWETSSRGTGFRVPIIGLTGSLSRAVEEECFAAGMDAFIAKPFQIADLRQLLKQYSMTTASL